VQNQREYALPLVFTLHRDCFEPCTSKNALQALIEWSSYVGIHPWKKVACALSCAVGSDWPAT
jgi:hypothetical protein